MGLSRRVVCPRTRGTRRRKCASAGLRTSHLQMTVSAFATAKRSMVETRGSEHKPAFHSERSEGGFTRAVGKEGPTEGTCGGGGEGGSGTYPPLPQKDEAQGKNERRGPSGSRELKARLTAARAGERERPSRQAVCRRHRGVPGESACRTPASAGGARGQGLQPRQGRVRERHESLPKAAGTTTILNICNEHRHP